MNKTRKNEPKVGDLVKIKFKDPDNELKKLWYVITKFRDDGTISADCIYNNIGFDVSINFEKEDIVELIPAKESAYDEIMGTRWIEFYSKDFMKEEGNKSNEDRLLMDNNDDLQGMKYDKKIGKQLDNIRERYKLLDYKYRHENRILKFDDITYIMNLMYIAKNKDYGCSFDKSVDEFGLVSAVTRMSDKMERMKSLLKHEAEVKSESLYDTVIDLATYAAMTALYIKNHQDGNKNEV